MQRIGSPQTNQASGRNDMKHSPTSKVHPTPQKHDLKVKNSMSDISRSCSNNDTLNSHAPTHVRRSGRQITPTGRGLESIASYYGPQEAFVFSGLSSVALSDAQAMADPIWKASRDAEIDSLKVLHSFRVVERESGMKVIPTRWVY